MSAPIARPPPPVRVQPNTLLDVMIAENPRRHGVQSGRITNGWLDCSYSIEPSIEPARGFQRGFRWVGVFKTVDEPSRKEFTGVKDTRARAKLAAVTAITFHIRAVADERTALWHRQRTQDRISVEAGVALAPGAPTDRP